MNIWRLVDRAGYISHHNVVVRRICKWLMREGYRVYADKSHTRGLNGVENLRRKYNYTGKIFDILAIKDKHVIGIEVIGLYETYESNELQIKRMKKVLAAYKGQGYSVEGLIIDLHTNETITIYS